jgi:HAD domain in Swiss Army Knife RNA repair proteins
MDSSRQTSQNGESSLKVAENSVKAPILFLDVDGVLSVFGFSHDAPPPGVMHSVEGIPHCIAHGCGERLLRLAEAFELVWATGWEERANEHLPHLLGLGGELPTLVFDEQPLWGTAHWKLSAIDRYAAGRAAAWVDDSLSEDCFAWAANRDEPTLLVATDAAVGLTDAHVDHLLAWARSQAVPSA